MRMLGIRTSSAQNYSHHHKHSKGLTRKYSGDMPRAPKATNCDSPGIGIDGHISAFEGIGKVVCEIEGEERCVAFREGKPLKTGTSRRGCFHANAVIKRKREIPGRCIFVGEIRLRCCAGTTDRLPSVLFIRRRSRPARLGLHVSNPPGQIKGMISKFP